MRLSVVIPTRGRPEMLAGCLQSLADQSEGSADSEVIVVDDGSPDPVEPVVQSFARRGLRAACIRQPQGGLNAARNRGVAESRGEIIAFLDDDTLVSPGWEKAIADGFAQTHCQALGGRITLKLEGELPRWVTQKRLTYLSEYDLGPQPLPISGPPLPFGANFAVLRSALPGSQPFRSGLDRVGKTLVSNGEIELLGRLLATGLPIIYWPDAEVVHRVPAERLTKQWFHRRAVAQGVSDILSQPPSAVPYPLRLAREVVRAGRALPILVRRLAEGRGSFDALLWLASSRARIAELRRLYGRLS